jgi:hypothetical protein
MGAGGAIGAQAMNPAWAMSKVAQTALNMSSHSG